MRMTVRRIPGTTPARKSRPIDTSLMKPNRMSPMPGGIVAVMIEPKARIAAVEPLE